MEILDLPEEVLLLIFSYIPLYNLFFSVQRTCQAWRNLCFHHSLWSTVHYSKQIDEKLSQDDLLDVLKQVSRGLHHLVFEKAFQHGEMNHTFLKILQCILNEDVDMRNISSLTIPDIPNRYLEPLLEKCSNLSSIEVSYYYAYYNKGDFFVTMKKLPHLKVFKITESSKSVESIAEPALNQHMFNLFLSDMFCSLVELEVVHIATVNKLTDDALGALLHNCKNLQELALYGCDSISNAGFKYLPEKSGITSLHLNSTSVNDKGMEHICRSCNGLRKVSFAGCMYVTDISIKHLCMNCPNLESLCVSDPEIFYHKSNITDGGLDYLSQNSHFLRSLTMCNSAQISDLGLDQLARSCSRLTHLDVSGCLSVSDNTLQVLAQHCRHLQTVNFSECVHLTGKGLNPLVVSCKWLRTLNVANCPFVQNLNFELFDQMETPFDRYLRERGEFSQRSNQLHDKAGEKKEEDDLERVQLESLQTCSNHEQKDGGKPQEGVQKLLEDLEKPAEDVEKLHKDLEEPQEGDEKSHEDVEKPHEGVEKPHQGVEKPHQGDLTSKCEKTTPRLNFLNSLSCPSIPSPKVHSELRILNIGLCSKVTDNCLRQIATYCPDLRELDINGCFNTTDLGISYIVRGCQSLELLNISSGSMIQKMGLTDQSLVSIASHCKHLRRLHVEKNPLMSLDGYKNLFDNCPLPCTVSLTTKSPEALKRDILMMDNDTVNKCKRVNVFSKGCYKGNIHQLDVLLYNSDGHILE